MKLQFGHQREVKNSPPCETKICLVLFCFESYARKRWRGPTHLETYITALLDRELFEVDGVPNVWPCYCSDLAGLLSDKTY